MSKQHFNIRSNGLRLALLVLWCAAVALAQTTQFTYQGSLNDGSSPANGAYDLQFRLFDALSGGAQIGATLTLANVAVSNGIFKVTLDFGAGAFPGANRFLEIAVRPGASSGAYTTLSPRQPVSSTPYSIKSLNAATADALSAACVDCVTSSQISSVVGSQITGTLPVASLPAGSTHYVRNTSTQQTSANFNISGNGTAGGTLSGDIVNTATQYNLNGSRVLSAPGTNNLFVGRGVGEANTTGWSNTFVGQSAGNTNTIGNNNTIIGQGADVGANNLFNATAIGAGAVVSTSNTIVLGRSGGPDTVRVPGILRLGVLVASTATHVCISDSLQLATCSSSLRYKQNVAPLAAGLSLIQRLRPVSFSWKESQQRDLGLIAEEVAAIEPLLVTRNAQGEVEGVKYDQLNVVLINAIKQQQQQIEQQQAQIRQQQTEIEALKRLVCLSHPQAAACQPKQQ